MNLVNKSREQINKALALSSKPELLEMIYQLATIEPHFSPGTIATLNEMDKRTIIRDAHAGKFGGVFYKRAGNQVRLSAAGVLFWRENFKVVVPKVGADGHVWSTQMIQGGCRGSKSERILQEALARS